MVPLTKRMAGFGKKVFRTTLGKLVNGVGWRLRHLYDQGLYRLTFMHSRKLRNTVFIGVTPGRQRPRTAGEQQRFLTRLENSIATHTAYGRQLPYRQYFINIQIL